MSREHSSIDAEAFHKRLDVILQESGMPLKKIACLSGVPYRTLVNIRSKRSSPDLVNFFKLTLSLGIDANEFWRAEDAQVAFSIERKQIMDLVDGFSNVQRKLAMKLLEAVNTTEF